MAMDLNARYAEYLMGRKADFVRFVDASPMGAAAERYPRAVVFGRALSKGYLRDLMEGRPPERREFANAESAMGRLSKALAAKLAGEGYESVTGIKPAKTPHKTVARLAGLGFIGKNLLLVTEGYGCAVVLGKVLTAAPFEAGNHTPVEQGCGDCRACVDACPTGALTGRAWEIGVSRDDMLIRSRCTICMRCLVRCVHTVRYMGGV